MMRIRKVVTVCLIVGMVLTSTCLSFASSNNNPVIESHSIQHDIFDPMAVTWGAWQDVEPIVIKTSGRTEQAIILAITLATPFKTAAVISIANYAVTQSLAEVRFEGKLRYGNDGTFMYYEREYDVYGITPSGNRIYITTLSDSGKTNGGSIQSIDLELGV